MTKIKPCPFCGVVPFVGYSGSTCKCENKDCILYEFIFPVDRWNKRSKKIKKHALVNDSYIYDIMMKLESALREITIFRNTDSGTRIINEILAQEYVNREFKNE